MTRDWEEQFRIWAKPPGKTEQTRCDNAVSAIRNAIKSSDKLKSRNIEVFTQGSYRNDTNVRRDSDVDIGILCTNTFYLDLPDGTTMETFNISPATYHYEQYKNEVGEALVKHFGDTAVKRGNKAFDVHETSYHVDADVAPFFEHRRYNPDGTYSKGVELETDRGNQRIINWPEQHYESGVSKNQTTGNRYKNIVRVLKALSNEMVEARVSGADLPGFLIECMTWNVSNDNFQHTSYRADVQAVLAFLFNNTMREQDCSNWLEVSGFKWLFRSSQKWTWQQAHAFASAAWDFIGFKE